MAAESRGRGRGRAEGREAAGSSGRRRRRRRARGEDRGPLNELEGDGGPPELAVPVELRRPGVGLMERDAMEARRPTGLRPGSLLRRGRSAGARGGRGLRARARDRGEGDERIGRRFGRCVCAMGIETKVAALAGERGRGGRARGWIRGDRAGLLGWLGQAAGGLKRASAMHCSPLS
mgnify:CR=1 FL=1